MKSLQTIKIQTGVYNLLNKYRKNGKLFLRHAKKKLNTNLFKDLSSKFPFKQSKLGLSNFLSKKANSFLGMDNSELKDIQLNIKQIGKYKIFKNVGNDTPLTIIINLALESTNIFEHRFKFVGLAHEYSEAKGSIFICILAEKNYNEPSIFATRTAPLPKE